MELRFGGGTGKNSFFFNYNFNILNFSIRNFDFFFSLLNINIFATNMFHLSHYH